MERDPGALRFLRATLERVGLTTFASTVPSRAEAIVREAPASLVVVSDEVLRELGGRGWVLRLRSLAPDSLRILVRCTGGVDAAIEAGADDVLTGSPSASEVVLRVATLRRGLDAEDALSETRRDDDALLALTQELAASLDHAEILGAVVRGVADVARLERVCLVLVDGPDGDAFMVATNDDWPLANVRLDVGELPSLREVLERGEALVSERAAPVPGLDRPSRSVASPLALLPIPGARAPLGLLFLRSDGSLRIDARALAFCRGAAHATALALRNARAQSSLRDASQRSTFERFTAERRLREGRRALGIAPPASPSLRPLWERLANVIGSAEVLRQRVPTEAPEGHAVAVILKEAARMAEVLREAGAETQRASAPPRRFTGRLVNGEDPE
ncbi:MAG: hypothetical protein ACFCGT_17085 [Sandaracinaceae bacterium]